MRKCSSCLRSTFDSAKFCHHCGAKMGTETLDCPDCNHANSMDAKVCESCGFDFSAPVSPTKKKSIFADIVEENEEKEKVKDELEETLELVSESPVLDNTLEAENETNSALEEDETEMKEDEEIEDSFEFTLEKTTEKTTDSILKKANIPFEIVENPVKEQPDMEVESLENTSTNEPIIESTDLIEDIEIEEETSAIIDDEEIEELVLETPPPINDLFEENPTDNVEEEIYKKFADAFEKQLKTEQNPAKYNTYVDRFEASDFKLSFEFRVKQLAEEIQKIRQDKSNLLQNEETLLERAFTELTDYFIIRYCEDLNRVHLSENILQYQNIAAENIDLSNLILDYLDFDNERERVNFDFIKMPLKRLQNASKSYLFPEKGEKIFFICDQTMLGSGKEGFAMTEKAIYWKMQFENPERVYYKNLQAIEPQKDWIVINEMFFNANPSLNVKMMKLLRKLKTIV